MKHASETDANRHTINRRHIHHTLVHRQERNISEWRLADRGTLSFQHRRACTTQRLTQIRVCLLMACSLSHHSTRHFHPPNSNFRSITYWRITPSHHPTQNYPTRYSSIEVSSNTCMRMSSGAMASWGACLNTRRANSTHKQ